MTGVGVKQDQKRAVSLFEKSCNAGMPGGCLNLGFASLQGSGAEKNPERAKALFQRGCELGLRPACDAYRRASKAR
jgi:TPR repeat protein